MHPLRALVEEIMEENGIVRSPLAVGKRFVYSDNDCAPHIVEIVGGFYRGPYGGISNFWDWKAVLPDGSLSEKNKWCGCGYDNGENGRKFETIAEPTT